jgi:uncharacterized protein YcbX
MAELIGAVADIRTYPLTGARCIEAESAVLGPGGFDGDHVFLLYGNNKDGRPERVSQKQTSLLAQLTPRFDSEGRLHIVRDTTLVEQGATPWGVTVPALAQASFVEVLEFGDPTPCIDMGDDVAKEFSDFLGRDVRLARKIDEWLAGGGIEPAARANATLHIGLHETVEFLADKLSNPDIGTDRIRAELIVKGFPALADASWVGGILLIGDKARVSIDCHTKRCPVPGHDQITGQNMKDLPRAYPYTVKAPDDGKPTIGVYGHSLTDTPVEIRHGDEVRWVPKD